MQGAEAFDTSILKGRTLINLDSNEENVFTVGCAGGPAVRIEIPITREKINSTCTVLHINISGLIGGHSGEDIHLDRANSIKLMARLLLDIDREIELQLIDLSGGLKYNAIPREANAEIMVPEGSFEKVKSVVTNMAGILRNEYRITDPEIAVTLETSQRTVSMEALTKSSTSRVLNYIYFAETGITHMDLEFKDTVESSVSLGVIRTEDEYAVLQTLTRSSLKSRYTEMYNKIVSLAESVGGKVLLMSNCPEWEYNPGSQIKTIFQDTYKRMYGKDPGFVITHAGLECGVIKKNSAVPIDMIAAGPVARNLHTPGEYVSISSTVRFWSFLREVIKVI
jgi:dipeptidase D